MNNDLKKWQNVNDGFLKDILEDVKTLALDTIESQSSKNKKKAREFASEIDLFYITLPFEARHSEEAVFIRNVLSALKEISGASTTDKTSKAATDLLKLVSGL